MNARRLRMKNMNRLLNKKNRDGNLEELIRKIISNQWAMGLAIAIPTWLFSDKPTVNHAVMIIILLGVFVLDWLTGTTLARRSPVKRRTSHAGIDALFRDFIIVLICSSAILLDFVFQTKSFIFAFFTAAFIWQNFYSFLGNVAALGWSRWFPMWLFKLIQDEMIVKLHKYFPTGKDIDGKDVKND